MVIFLHCLKLSVSSRALFSATLARQMQDLFAALCSLTIITFGAASDEKSFGFQEQKGFLAGRNQPCSAQVPQSMELS